MPDYTPHQKMALMQLLGKSMEEGGQAYTASQAEKAATSRLLQGQAQKAQLESQAEKEKLEAAKGAYGGSPQPGETKDVTVNGVTLRGSKQDNYIKQQAAMQKQELSADTIFHKALQPYEKSLQNDGIIRQFLANPNQFDINQVGLLTSAVLGLPARAIQTEAKAFGADPQGMDKLTSTIQKWAGNPNDSALRQQTLQALTSNYGVIHSAVMNQLAGAKQDAAGRAARVNPLADTKSMMSDYEQHLNTSYPGYDQPIKQPQRAPANQSAPAAAATQATGMTDKLGSWLKGMLNPQQQAAPQPQAQAPAPQGPAPGQMQQAPQDQVVPPPAKMAPTRQPTPGPTGSGTAPGGSSPSTPSSNMPLTPGQPSAGQPGKVRVRKGQEQFDIDASDLPHAVADGYQPVQ